MLYKPRMRIQMEELRSVWALRRFLFSGVSYVHD